MLEKVLSIDGTFFLLHTLKPGSKVGIIQFDKLEFGEQIYTAPKPPLCKGRWAKSLILLGGVANPSVSLFG